MPFLIISVSWAAPESADVVIVGAGLSGLMAARTLVQSEKVGSVVIFEARQRVGGRTLNRPLAKGIVAELGGQWVGPTQTKILGLVKELGLKTFPTHITGKTVINLSGFRYETASVDEGPGRLSQKVDALARQVPLEKPWDAPLAKKWGVGTGYKVNLLYDRPFWRDKGLSGISMGFGISALTMDNSPANGSSGVMLIFTEPRLLPRDLEARKMALARALVKPFGKEALDVRGMQEKDWGSSDPWTAGCVTPNPPGLLTRYGRTLRKPLGLIHWAGTETAWVWCGYMEGAIRAGERAAFEVLDTF